MKVKEIYSQSFKHAIMAKVMLTLSFMFLFFVNCSGVNKVNSDDVKKETNNETGNKEYLLDAMNYLMFEFMYPQRKGAFFKATDSKESAGIVGISAKEMEDLKNEDY